MAESFSIKVKLEGMTRFDQETKTFVGLCPRLKVYAQGGTEEEAKTALRESVRQYIEVCFHYNTLDEVMHKAGFTKVVSRDLEREIKEYVRIERTPYQTRFDMEIPIQLVAAEAASCGISPSSSIGA
jgi:predicted RNase H-like HicB family nuclease